MCFLCFTILPNINVKRPCSMCALQTVLSLNLEPYPILGSHAVLYIVSRCQSRDGSEYHTIEKALRGPPCLWNPRQTSLLKGRMSSNFFFKKMAYQYILEQSSTYKQSTIGQEVDTHLWSISLIVTSWFFNKRSGKKI